MSNLDFIINPVSNRRVSIYSRKGIEIINKYVEQLGGHNGPCALNESSGRCKKSKVADGNCEVSPKGRCRKAKTVTKKTQVATKTQVTKKRKIKIKKKKIKKRNYNILVNLLPELYPEFGNTINEEVYTNTDIYKPYWENGEKIRKLIKEKNLQNGDLLCIGANTYDFTERFFAYVNFNDDEKKHFTITKILSDIDWMYEYWDQYGFDKKPLLDSNVIEHMIKADLNLKKIQNTGNYSKVVLDIIKLQEFFDYDLFQLINLKIKSGKVHFDSERFCTPESECHKYTIKELNNLKLYSEDDWKHS